jgi:transcriptional regulator with XRE-family HTH domain
VTEINRESRETIARNIAAQRKRIGYSKLKLATEAGVTDWQLRTWESGRTEPTARSLLKLAPVLGQSLEWFYTDHGDGLPGNGG